MDGFEPTAFVSCFEIEGGQDPESQLLSLSFQDVRLFVSRKFHLSEQTKGWSTNSNFLESAWDQFPSIAGVQRNQILSIIQRREADTKSGLI
jgi:hypothetical protein